MTRAKGSNKAVQRTTGTNPRKVVKCHTLAARLPTYSNIHPRTGIQIGPYDYTPGANPSPCNPNNRFLLKNPRPPTGP